MKETTKIISNFLIFAVVFVAFGGCKKDKETPPAPNPPPPLVLSWKFETVPVWIEEFNYTGEPDPAKWTFETGGHGWGNNELQYYTDSGNATVNNGILKITAKKESISGKDYTSARLISKNQADWLYGRIEVKAKLPKGRGTWPAIWMLPTENAYGNWPNSGEIDIMEHVGFDPDRVHFTIHTKAYNHTLNTQRGGNKIVPGATDSFHLYRLDWAPYGIRGFIDNEQIFELRSATGFEGWPFDKKFFVILNIAVGGNWGGQQGIDDTAFPATLDVDYIRVYKFLE